MSKKWTIESTSKFAEPYCRDGKESNEICGHLNTEVWETDDKEMALAVIRDFLDAPDAEISIDDVKRDFEKIGEPLPKEKLEAIREYYNGRLLIWRDIEKRVKEFDCSCNKTFHIEIPEKLNSFFVYGEDDGKVKQELAFIEVTFACK